VSGLLGILIGLGLLISFAFRGWSVLLLAPLAALIAAMFSREPLLAHWTQTFMLSAAGFLAQFFPLFLLGALFGKLMEDSGSVAAIASFMTQRLGPQRAILAVVLAGALVTYGGVSLFVAFFVLVPMAQELFRVAGIPRRLMPAAIVLGPRPSRCRRFRARRRSRTQSRCRSSARRHSLHRASVFWLR
jgi:H+/gluconate symporter-like permease